MDLAYYYELWRGMMLSADPAVAERRRLVAGILCEVLYGLY